MASKRDYVLRRTARMSMDELVSLALAVQADYTSPGLDHILALTGARDTTGRLRNLIFAALGPKPRIVLRDAVDNVIEIVEGADRVLVYDRNLAPTGLTWRELVDWYAAHRELGHLEERARALALHARLMESLGDNGAEQVVLGTYARLYGTHGYDIPALVPQVYPHYDPYTRARGGVLVRQRMDFLVLAAGRRIVIEVDGKTHYTDGAGRPDPKVYAQMVREDRRLRLDGYEVYRFGGAELGDKDEAAVMLTTFFTELLGLRTSRT